jgi:hypothetical protein
MIPSALLRCGMAEYAPEAIYDSAPGVYDFFCLKLNLIKLSFATATRSYVQITRRDLFDANFDPPHSDFKGGGVDRLW